MRTVNVLFLSRHLVSTDKKIMHRNNAISDHEKNEKLSYCKILRPLRFFLFNNSSLCFIIFYHRVRFATTSLVIGLSNNKSVLFIYVLFIDSALLYTVVEIRYNTYY
jgi:hypothetical protein